MHSYPGENPFNCDDFNILSFFSLRGEGTDTLGTSGVYR